MVASTFQPRSRNSFAVSRPKPDEQPVIRTVFMDASSKNGMAHVVEMTLETDYKRSSLFL
jgi:hypothetical protein